MVKRGNPLGITSIGHLLDPIVRFVNRDPESGTRFLFDQYLLQQNVEKSRINYEQVEFTHAAFAAYVASDMADASFGVEAAARQFDPILSDCSLKTICLSVESSFWKPIL